VVNLRRGYTPLGSRSRLRADASRIRQPELVHEFEQFLDDNEGIGSMVLYLRRDLDVKHECWQTTSQHSRGIKACPECYGTGYAVSIERHVARDWGEASPGRQAQSYPQTEPGRVPNPSHSFAMKPNARPKVGDFIFKVEWNEATEMVLNLIEAHEVERVEDKRQEQGVLVFYKVYCQGAGVNEREVERLLRQEQRIRIVD